MRVILLITVFTIASLLCFQKIYAAQGDIQITGVYSNMHYGEDSGDLNGMEMLIIRPYCGFYVIIQFAVAEPLPPIIIKSKITKSYIDRFVLIQIEFDVPDMNIGLPEYTGRFRGNIFENGIKGIFAETGKEVFFKRKKDDYWQ